MQAIRFYFLGGSKTLYDRFCDSSYRDTVIKTSANEFHSYTLNWNCLYLKMTDANYPIQVSHFLVPPIAYVFNWSGAVILIGSLASLMIWLDRLALFYFNIELLHSMKFYIYS